MLVVAVLCGWSSSSAGPGKTLADIVERELEPIEHVVLAKRALFSAQRARQFRRFVQRNDSVENVLLCAGKSLGGKIMVRDVLNRLGGLTYREKYLLTVDINWPTVADLTPNLNRTVVQLTRPMTHAINVVGVGSPREQCGALLAAPPGTPVENRLVRGFDHRSITTAPPVERAIRDLLRSLI